MSLRSRLVVAVAAISLVALLVAGVATYSSLRSFLYDGVDHNLEATADSLQHPGAPGQGGGRGGQPSSPPSPGSKKGMPPPTVQADAPGVSVELRESDGSVKESYPGHQPGGKSYSPRLPVRITGFTKDGPGPPQVFFTASSTTPGGPAVRVLAIEQPDGETLILGVSLAGTQGTLGRLVVIELIVAGAALLAAVLLGLWLVRLGLRPLAGVEETAERIATGQLDERVPGESSRTEVGRLARTINVMLGRIQEAFAERQASEERLRASEERMRRFVADASHELRTPLAAVSAYAELFERGAKEHPGDLERVMAGIRGETSRMGQLVEDLFLLARLDEGRPIQHDPLDLVALAQEAVGTARAVGPSWPVTLEAAEPVEVMGDPARLRQVFDNLLGNVRAHTTEGTEATVSVAVDPGRGEAVITVADRGPGVGEGATRVFERFYRADPSRSGGGAGLGLAIVAAIVAAHGGRVAAAERDGGGTEVTVRLPLAPAPDAGATGDGGDR